MSSTTMARRWFALLCALALLLVAPGASVALAGTGPSVMGGGAGFFPATSPAFPGDRIQVELTARSLPGGTFQGEFNIVHHRASGGLFAYLNGVVDCLTVAGNTAVVTGTITQGFTALGIPPAGQRVSMTIVDGGVDTFGIEVSLISGVRCWAVTVSH